MTNERFARQQERARADAEQERSARQQAQAVTAALQRAAWVARHGVRTPPADIHDLRRGRWYDEKPITTTSTGSAGGAVSSIEEVRAGIMAANEAANEALGALQQAHASLETAQGALMRAVEGSGQNDAVEALGLLAQSIATVEEARQQVAAEISSAEGVGNRL